VNRGTGARCHQPQARRHRDRAFTGFAEQPFPVEPRLELLEGLLQGAQTGGFDGFGDQLEVAACLIEADFARTRICSPSAGTVLTVRLRLREHRAADLGAVILEAEVPVARCRARQSGEFTLHPDLQETDLKKMANLVGQLAHADGVCSGCRGLPSLRIHLPQRIMFVYFKSAPLAL